MTASIGQNVLVLNRLWQAVHVCSVRRAFTLLYAGHAHVVHEEGDSYQTLNFEKWHDISQDYCGADVVSTVAFKVRVPRVIVLLFYDRFPKKEVKFTRNNIFDRDKHTCQYCGKVFPREMLNLDHVVPRDRGGQMSWENIVCSCIPCNTRKGNRTPSEAGMRLLRQPKRPRWRPSLHVTFAKASEDSWRNFLDLSCWHVEVG